MKRNIENPRELGQIVRAVRKSQALRQDELAATIPASHVFVLEVERGKPTAQIGKILQLLRELGIRVTLDFPEEAGPLLNRSQST